MLVAQHFDALPAKRTGDRFGIDTEIVVPQDREYSVACAQIL